MPLARIIIKNFKSIRNCDIAFSDLNIFIGENGTGKSNLLEAIEYFYSNLISSSPNMQVFDENNKYSNEARIALIYDLSEFVKISKSNTSDLLANLSDEPVNNSKYSSYYKAIIAMAAKSNDMRFRVELTQIKGQSILWNCSYEDRLFFKSLFPIFFVDTRTLDITQWSYVWDTLGELSKVSNSERKEIEHKINNILFNESAEIPNKLKAILEIFETSNVSVKPAKSKEFAKNLAKVFFSGESIQQNGKRLGYYSAGTNSVKYIELLLRAIDEIAKTKLKEPIILFDEPEISLHTYFLDELADAMINTSAKMCIVLSTHSSRLVKNLVSKNYSSSLFNVKLLENYSCIQKMKKFSQYSPSSKYRVTDDHINSYFSRAILFVEGETELELFSNPYLLLLFPKLKNVDVFQAMSQKPILNIMNPRLNKARTPYLCLIDMDKAIAYERQQKRFRLQNEYFQNNGKERYLYRNKHQSTPYLFHQRNHIEKMVASLHIHYFLPYLSSNDPNYYCLVSAVHQYLLSYNIFSFTTTIEGALVNRYTTDFSLNYLQERIPSSFPAFKNYWDTLGNTDKINALRIVFNGKSDLLQTRKTILKNMPLAEKAIIENSIIGSKTSGWVSEYLDGFFKMVANISGDLNVKEFRKCLEDDQQKRIIIQQFQCFFPELFSLIDKLCGMVRE